MTKFSLRVVGVSRLSAGVGAGAISRIPEEPSEVAHASSGGSTGGAESLSGLPPSAMHPAFDRGGSATRRRVIEAGARVFAELGFNAATKERIGAAAGFSHQTVRDYFRTKEGLLAAIVADAWRSLLSALSARPEATPLEQVLSAYDALDALARSRPAEARCVLHEAHLAGPHGAPMRVDEERAFHAAVAQIVTGSTGLRGADAITRAEALVAAMEGLARPNVVHADGDAHASYAAPEARRSFRTLAASLLQPAS